MFTIIIKKTPSARLFDRMPLPKTRTRIRSLSISRKELSAAAFSPFQRKVSRIR